MKWKFLLNLFTYFSLRLGLMWNSPPWLGVFHTNTTKKSQHRLFTLCHVSNISFVPFSAVPSFIWNSRNAHKKNEREERKREREMRSGKNILHIGTTRSYFILPDHACKFAVFSVENIKRYTLLLSFWGEGEQGRRWNFFYHSCASSEAEAYLIALKIEFSYSRLVCIFVLFLCNLTILCVVVFEALCVFIVTIIVVVSAVIHIPKW